jgi:serine/threonine-protein kinase
LFLHRLRFKLLQWGGHADARPTEFAATVVSTDRPGAGAAVDEAAAPPEQTRGSAAAEVQAAGPTAPVTHIGRYQINGRLGAGGLGEVFEAWDPLLSRSVAVKTLRLQLDPELRALLDDHILNEARAAAGLNHPNIVTVYDAGLCTPGVYIAMERLHGRDLRQALTAGWGPTPLQAAQLARRVAEALAYAHGKGVVHCDIKPANIFLDHEDRPKVLDFGIARMTQDRQRPRGEAAGTSDAATAVEEPLFGSPHYLAPEQLQEGQADARTDVRALGVVLYELLTGRKAYMGDSVEQVVNAVLFNHPAPAHEVRGGVPRTLSAIAERAMARNPERRYAAAEDMARELREWCDRHAETPAPGTGPQARAAARSQAKAARKRHSAGWAVAGVALCVAAAAWLWWLSSPLPLQQQLPLVAAQTEPGQASLGSGAGKAVNTPRETSTASEKDAGSVPPATAKTNNGKPATSTPMAKRPQDRAASTTPLAKKPAGETTANGKGAVLLSISPWGEVEVNGRAAGTTPPLSQLSLPAGRHTITVRNVDFPAYTTTVVVQADKPALVRHRFTQ